MASPVRATDEEKEILQSISEYLEERDSPSVLLGSGRRIELPRSLFLVLCEAVEVLLQGGAVSIMPYHAELTTQQAADYLGVSRPYLIKLLEQNEIKYTRLNSHRRIMLRDLEEYRERRDATRRAALAELTREAFESGLYREQAEVDREPL